METGPSTSAARTYMYYPSLPPTADSISQIQRAQVSTSRMHSKTVPIWCAVINRATRLRRLVETPSSSLDIAAAADLDLNFNLHTPPGVASPHEHAQIAAWLDGWAAALANSSYALPELAQLLRPQWITPASARFPYVAPDTSSFSPVICVSASRAGGFSYVQGSGGDYELWDQLPAIPSALQSPTPQLFRKHRAELIACSRELDAMVVKLVAAALEVGQPLLLAEKSRMPESGAHRRRLC